VGKVLRVALGLGLTSFGGPIARLGYFERAYVRERHWLSAEEYVGLVALCQMLPGPASSQTGFLVGLRRAGLPGAVAARMLYDPIWVSAVRGGADVAIALAGLPLLEVWRVPPLGIVVFCVCAALLAAAAASASSA